MSFSFILAKCNIGKSATKTRREDIYKKMYLCIESNSGQILFGLQFLKIKLLCQQKKEMHTGLEKHNIYSID